MQLQIDEHSFLCSAPALTLPQWAPQLASCLDFEPRRFCMTLAELSWRGPPWTFWSPLLHRDLTRSLYLLRFACPPCPLSQVPRACLTRPNPCPQCPMPAGHILLISCHKLLGNLVENPSKSLGQGIRWGLQVCPTVSPKFWRLTGCTKIGSR